MKKKAFLLFSVLLAMTSCNKNFQDELLAYNELQKRDYPSIQKKGELVVYFENNSSSYFEDKGQKMGFEYEILENFCKDHQLKLVTRVIENRDNITELLNTGKADVIATNLSVTNTRKRQIDFSHPFLNEEQVLIQRKKDPSSGTEFITDATQLARKNVNVWAHSAYYTKLKNIQNEIGDTIYIQPENGDISTDFLIEQVADGTIDYTITDRNIALINQYYWDNIDISLPLSFKQKIAFGIRKHTPKLKAELNEWLDHFKTTNLYSYLNYKYFQLASTAKKALSSSLNFNSKNVRKIIKKETKGFPFDWEVIAAIVYRESRFNPDIVGLGGAYGLFQFMPITGKLYGVYPNSDIETQVKGGVRYFYGLYRMWKNIPNEEDRLKFSIASYNSGHNHVIDAVALARKHHLKPNVWDNNVAIMFANLSNSEYYNDSVVKYGAARGEHTVQYVNSVYNKYLEFKNVH